MSKCDLTIIRGDNTDIEFVLTNDGVAVDLTGSSVYFTAKPALTDDDNDSTAVIAVEVTVHTDPTNGKTVIKLYPEDTDISAGTYYYDIQIKSSTGVITSIKHRQLEVIADVTRRTSELS